MTLGSNWNGARVRTMGEAVAVGTWHSMSLKEFNDNFFNGRYTRFNLVRYISEFAEHDANDRFENTGETHLQELSNESFSTFMNIFKEENGAVKLRYVRGAEEVQESLDVATYDVSYGIAGADRPWKIRIDAERL